MYVLVWIYMKGMCEGASLQRAEKGIEFQDLELQTFMSFHVGVGNWIQVFYKSNKHF